MTTFIESQIGGLGPALFYLTLFVIIYLETAVILAFFIPGDTLLFTAGLIVATSTDLNILTTATIVALAAFLGDQTAYRLGRRFGYGYITSKNKNSLNHLLSKAEIFYEKHGISSMFLARFYPWFRTLIPFLAGVSRMNSVKFGVVNLLSAISWGFGITYLGYFANSNPQLKDASRYIAAFFIVLSIALAIKNYLSRDSEKVA
jgi:membrane-associated protein